MVSNGQVYVGTSNSLVIYGLLVPPTVTPTAPTNLTATAVSGVQVNLGWQDNSNNESGFFIELSTDGGNNWSQVAIAGVATNSYSLTSLTPGVAYSFRVRAFNGVGNSVYTNIASATTFSPTPVLDFSSGFSNAATLLALNGTATSIIGSALRLTDGNTNRASSAFSATAVSVTRFTTAFSFQMTSATAEGLTFTIQRAGSTSVGANGSGLGYGGIATSVALKFDIFSNSGEGTDSTGVFINGATPAFGSASLDMTSSGLLLRNGNVVQVSLNYDGTTVQQTVTDTVTHAVFTHSYAIDIPGTIGGTTAFVGFTASTGASTSTQNMLSWSYTPLPAPPAMPGNFTVTPASGTELDLGWTQSTQPVDHFNILKLTAPSTYTLIAQVPGNVTTYPDGGLMPGTSYSYEVVASNA
ncbi:MAG TPA: fibronectin type III domain-containing protein, partial [Tepidisphaeraceae bacterium]